MKTKISVRYFNNVSIRAKYDEKDNQWLYSATDIVKAITNSKEPRKYWNAFKRRNKEIEVYCKQTKLTAADGKAYLTDILDEDGVSFLLMNVRGYNKLEMSKWIKGLANPIDEKSRIRAYELFENGLLDFIEVGTFKGLQKIHSYLFDGLYDFAGVIRDKNISKNGFIFANCSLLPEILKRIDNMSEKTFDEIIDKYIEMNVAHPFMEGNGRATRIWLDQILKKNLGKIVDWSKIDKKKYLSAMEESPLHDEKIKKLIFSALTDEINSKETFMKGIDYSYYYEEIE